MMHHVREEPSKTVGALKIPPQVGALASHALMALGARGAVEDCFDTLVLGRSRVALLLLLRVDEGERGKKNSKITNRAGER